VKEQEKLNSDGIFESVLMLFAKCYQNKSMLGETNSLPKLARFY